MSHCPSDPWQEKNNSIEFHKNGVTDIDLVVGINDSFEDNFMPEPVVGPLSASNNNNPTEGDATRPHEPLPDSANYLQLLERKLAKVQKGDKLLDSLQAKRQDCMRALLSSNGVPTSTLEQLLELDTPVESGRLHRHLLPVQALTVGETVHIVEHDALEQQQSVEEEEEHQKENTN